MKPHTHQVVTGVLDQMRSATSGNKRVVPAKTVASWIKALALAAKIDPLYVPERRATTVEEL